MRRADEAHGETAKDEKREEREMGAGEGMKSAPPKKAKEADKKMAPETGKGSPMDGGDEDQGDIGDVVEMHGPAHEVNMKMDHAQGMHQVESVHGEKRHKKSYNNPVEAMRHAHVAMGLGEPNAQQATPGTAEGQDTMSMLQNMGQPQGL
jgi:hypothetical protein